MSDRRRILSYALVGTVLILFTLFIGLKVRENRASSGISTETFVANIAECLKDPAKVLVCGTVVVKDMLRSHSASETMDILYQNFPEELCHSIGHIVGQQVQSNTADLETAIRECGTTCTGSCIHGAVGQAFVQSSGIDLNNVDLQHLSIDDIREHVRQLCFSEQTCHGLGHVLFLLSNELYEPIHICNQIERDYQRQICLTGVFMEHADITSSNNLLLGTKKKQYRDPDNLLYPCDAVGTDERFTCYRFLPIIQELIFIDEKIPKNDWAAIQQKNCEQLTDLHDRNSCFDGLGYRHFALVKKDQKAALRYCEKFPRSTDRASCMLGMILWATQYGHLKESLSYCDAVSGKYEQGICYHAIFDSLTRLPEYREDRVGMVEVCGEQKNSACTRGFEAYIEDPWYVLFGLKVEK